MKQNLFLKLLVLVACLSSALSATAYDFSATYNGKTIYYNIVDQEFVEVTSREDNSYSASYSGAVTIPSSVTWGGQTWPVIGIGDEAFDNTAGNGNLTSISLPSSIEYIGKWAFYKQSSLTSVTLPSNLNRIDYGAFNNCSALTSITIPNYVNTIGENAFGSCYSLRTVNFGTGLTSIDDFAFKNDVLLTEVVIPDKVTTIGDAAFWNCTGITKFTLGKSVTSIGEQALEFAGTYTVNGTSYLRQVEIHMKSINPPTISSNTFGESNSSYNLDPYYMYRIYTVNPYSRSLYKAATYWSNFYCLQNTSYDYLVEQKYDFLVNGIYYLITGSNTVKVTNKNGGTLLNDNITSYTGHITVPLTAIYSDLNKTYNVTAIGTHAFDETRLMNLNSTGEAPSLRGTQGDLKSVTVGNNVTTIEDYAFTNATGLACVSLGSGVTSIGNYAFNGCTSLSAVFSRRTTPPTITSSTFDSNHYSATTVYVPTAAAVTSYKAANYWRNFTKIKVIPTLNEALNAPGGNINFTSTGSYPWMVMADGGGLYAMSGNGGVPSSTSTLTATVTVPTGGAPVTFDFKAWGEGSNSYIYDKCIFSVDGTQQYSYGARDNDWETYTVQLTAGTHTLTWTYSKDSSVNPTGDYFAVRNVKLKFEAYACYTESNKTLTFYYDGQRSTRTGQTFDLNTGDYIPEWYQEDNDLIVVNRAVFDPSFAAVRPTSTYAWFDRKWTLTSITGMKEYLNTSEVTTMGRMFAGCSDLTSLDLSGFNTANVTDMSYMFAGCSDLTSLDLSNFNTSKVSDMSYMFYDCDGLTSIDLSNFNTGWVDNMGGMFYGCEGLTSLDLSNFDTADVTDMSYMFAGCSDLTTIYASIGWSTTAVTDSYNMFYGCTSLVGGKGTIYNSNYVDKTRARIDGGPSNPGYFSEKTAAYVCYDEWDMTLTFYYDNQRSTRTGRTYLLNTGNARPEWLSDETSFSVTRVVFDPSFAAFRPTTTYCWFSDMRDLTSITGMKEYLNTSAVTNMRSMFNECSSLTSIDVSGFNTAQVTDMSYMFMYSDLRTLNLGSFNTARVTDMRYMFYGCDNLTTIYAASGWTTNAVTYSNDMFYDCTRLSGGMGTAYNSSHVDKSYAHIDGGTSNPGYFTISVQIGDANGDGQVTIADVTAIIDYLLTGIQAIIDPRGSDLTGDGLVTIADVTALIDMLLSGN